MAVVYEQYDILQMFLSNQRWSYDMKIKNRDGLTILHLAVK